MPFCSFCKQAYEIPRGMTLVMVDGAIKHLCSSKCRKNMLMKRRKVRWVLKQKREKVSKVKEETKAEIKEKVKEEKKTEAKEVVKEEKKTKEKSE